MSTTHSATGSFQVVMKNEMLNAWRQLSGGFDVYAYGGTGSTGTGGNASARSNFVDVTFGSASGGESSMTQSSISLTIENNTNVCGIVVRRKTDNVHIDFPLASADRIYFEHGGTLIIDDLNVKIND